MDIVTRCMLSRLYTAARIKYPASLKVSCPLSDVAGLRPRRSLLYVPGNEEKKARKATGLSADVVVLDCEDGVAVNKKEEARQAIVKLLPHLDFGSSESSIRINSAESEYAVEDLYTVITAPVLPNSLMIAKVEDPDQLAWLKSVVEKHLMATRRSEKQFSLIAQCETPKGMMSLRSILEEGCKPHRNLKLESFVFGSDDYLASIGGTRTPGAQELLFARQYFVMHVKGFGLQAIDMVDINFKDLDGLRSQSVEGARMGFTGKQVIHPAQVSVVNEAFTPGPDRVEYATELIKAFREHEESGKGAFAFRGSMIDMPSVKQAQNIVNLINLIRK